MLFYQKKYADAKRLLDVMQKNMPDDMEPIRLAKIKFFLACVFFMQADVEEAEKIIHKNSLLMKDKSGWAVFIRMLELMLFAVQNKKKELNRAAEGMKRYIEYTSRSGFVSARDKLIIDLFLLLSKNELASPSLQYRSYKTIEKKIQKTYKLLRSTKGDYAWDPFSHEIIRYDNWLVPFV